MSETNVFLVMLESSQQEQLPVRIFLTHHALSGIVTHIGTESVEIRTTEGQRGIILLNSIEAITGS
ncbi:hypothetical protein HHL17_23820 [Chitinophaga sp. G-6-1-13]|uniref:Uncharacterized protein n=1 Tax=Chitinophaga fulva TaxID=2728842 RepID=A0A848GSB1_9BACT|nr:hypothetical protein [Chitinophaga fulva]NML40249.1 hypothetical protein [Chitinophaga fulva]